jgi:thiol-disulfide isomerase/thioredoxin
MEVPFTRVTMLDGMPRLLEEYRGTPTVVLFWATNCSNSASVVAEFNEQAVKYNGSVRFLAVSLDKKLENVTERIRASKLNAIEHAFSGNEAYDEAYKSFGIEAIPHIFVINAEGVVVSDGTGMSAFREGIAQVVAQ